MEKRKACESVAIGRHAIDRFEPDIVIYRVKGKVDSADIQGLLRQQIAWYGHLGYLLSTVDVRHFQEATAGALQAAREGRSAKLPRCVAFWGANFTARVAAEMLFRALQMLAKGVVHYRFFETEEQCLDWLDEMRPWAVERRTSPDAV